ncbi:GNAT family N-acetyltransferase [Flavilitoribacter nigricans]|nr:GNAT family N-acetyltransferase [Flavilitoribacter nigricans]
MGGNYWQGTIVRLRGIEPEDAEFFYQWNQETETQRSLDRIWFPSSLERQREWTAKKATKALDDDGYFFVIENPERIPVGMVHTRDCDPQNGTFSYAVALKAAHRRKGYAREAVKMILNYYFQELRYHKVTVDIYDHNLASIALHEHLGFSREGRLRQMRFAGGKYFDVLKYGLLRKEFINFHSDSA